jgi:hypothetical protein
MTSPVAEAKAVVESGGARRRLSFGLIGLIVLGVTLVATAHVAVHAKRIEVAIALGKEERASRELTLQRRHLEIELGMRPPAPANIHAGLANAGEAIRVASPPALPAANHRGREWEPSQGSHQP